MLLLFWTMIQENETLNRFQQAHEEVKEILDGVPQESEGDFSDKMKELETKLQKLQTVCYETKDLFLNLWKQTEVRHWIHVSLKKFFNKFSGKLNCPLY